MSLWTYFAKIGHVFLKKNYSSQKNQPTNTSKSKTVSELLDWDKNAENMDRWKEDTKTIHRMN